MLHYTTYRRVKRQLNHKEQLAMHDAREQVGFKTTTSDEAASIWSYTPISIIVLLCSITIMCNNNRVYKIADMWLLSYLKRKSWANV